MKNLKYEITNDARCTNEIKSNIAMAKVAFNKRFFTLANWNQI
jgi:hypothetical protein